MQGGGGIPSLCRYVFFVNEFNLNILNCQVAVLFTKKRDSHRCLLPYILLILTLRTKFCTQQLFKIIQCDPKKYHL